MDLSAFAEEIGAQGPVTIAGMATRGGPVSGVRPVMAPAGVDWIRPEEMTVRCGAGTSVAELDEALAAVGQCVAIPPTGTVGGALAIGRSSIRRLGHGPIRDAVLQIDYVSAAGEIVIAGGPTVKNVTGFDLCRLLVASRGTLGFFGAVILRTRPRARFEQWFVSRRDPWDLLGVLHRPASVLWNGTDVWVLLDGDPADVAAQASLADLRPADPPNVPTSGRWSVPPSAIADATDRGDLGCFLAEIGVGLIHCERSAPARTASPEVVALHHRIKSRFDPSSRLNPGVDVLTAAE